jgi:hypothetical protein
MFTRLAMMKAEQAHDQERAHAIEAALGGVAVEAQRAERAAEMKNTGVIEVCG